MPVKVIERYVRGKYDDPDQCEDRIFINENYLAVIDGVTTKSDRRYDGKRSGRVAGNIICQTLSELTEAPDAVSVLNLLSRKIHDFSLKMHCKKNEIPRACIVLYSLKEKKILSYGDCQYRINGKTYAVHKKIDRMNETIRSYVISTSLKQGMSVTEIEKEDPGRKAIQPYLHTQYLYENEEGPFGYAVLNGDPVNPDLIHEMSVPSRTQVILASDGYPAVKDTLQETEDVLAEMLREDPLCYRINPQTKGLQTGQISYDDRSYIRFETE